MIDKTGSCALLDEQKSHVFPARQVTGAGPTDSEASGLEAGSRDERVRTPMMAMDSIVDRGVRGGGLK